MEPRVGELYKSVAGDILVRIIEEHLDGDVYVRVVVVSAPKRYEVEISQKPCDLEWEWFKTKFRHFKEHVTSDRRRVSVAPEKPKPVASQVVRAIKFKKETR